jgi:FMN phosphatase YigB (HAD superfamily)
LIQSEKGKYGLKILKECRQDLDGKGELALLALNIPFKKWALKLVDIDVSSVEANRSISKKIKNLDGVKILYTGSPRKLAIKLIKQIGLSEDDFDEIIAWEDETFPLKWTSNQLIYKYLSNKYSTHPQNMYSIGNDIDQDVLPIIKFGGTGILIGSSVSDTVLPNYKDINTALDALMNIVID